MEALVSFHTFFLNFIIDVIDVKCVVRSDIHLLACCPVLEQATRPFDECTCIIPTPSRPSRFNHVTCPASLRSFSLACLERAGGWFLAPMAAVEGGRALCACFLHSLLTAGPFLARSARVVEWLRPWD